MDNLICVLFGLFIVIGYVIVQTHADRSKMRRERKLLLELIGEPRTFCEIGRRMESERELLHRLIELERSGFVTSTWSSNGNISGRERAYTTTRAGIKRTNEIDEILND